MKKTCRPNQKGRTKKEKAAPAKTDPPIKGLLRHGLEEAPVELPKAVSPDSPFYRGDLKLGVDLGWYDMRYEVRTAEGTLLRRGGTPATPEALEKRLREWEMARSVTVAYEAGPQMYWIEAVIKKMKRTSHPFHAGAFVLAVKTKGKSDKKDAAKITLALVKGQLPPALYVPPETERRLRELLQEREDFRQEIQRWGNHLHALAIALGRALPKRFQAANEQHWDAYLESLGRDSSEGKRALRLYRQMLAARQSKEEVEEEIERIMEQKELKRARQILRSLAGIGFWVAAGLIAYCGPQALRFADGRRAASYFGLTANNYLSGGTNRNGHISKQGSALIRRLLNQAAWALLRSKAGRDSAWGKWFWRKTQGGKSRVKVMITALSRKILCGAIACLKNDVLWDPHYRGAAAA